MNVNFVSVPLAKFILEAASSMQLQNRDTLFLSWSIRKHQKQKKAAHDIKEQHIARTDIEFNHKYILETFFGFCFCFTCIVLCISADIRYVIDI